MHVGVSGYTVTVTHSIKCSECLSHGTKHAERTAAPARAGPPAQGPCPAVLVTLGARDKAGGRLVPQTRQPRHSVPEASQEDQPAASCLRCHRKCGPLSLHICSIPAEPG